ncbi:MAG TPA: hypothetical protein VGE45_00370 [Chloroflexia bacterium]
MADEVVSGKVYGEGTGATVTLLCSGYVSKSPITIDGRKTVAPRTGINVWLWLQLAYLLDRARAWAARKANKARWGEDS